MPVVVPALRFFVVFLNVYETFKTLKPPPPSARRGGQPSVRAMAQRKRDLKGCLAVWVVWCCYAVYERTFDRLVGIFLPFYSEMKSVFLLFLVLTRAKGAEPLFLHVLRPFVKPYAVIMDPILELSRDIGDFVFALLQVPLDYILSLPWMSSWRTGDLEDEPGKFPSACVDSVNPASFTRASSHSNNPAPADRTTAVQVSSMPNKHRVSIRSVSDNNCSNGYPSVFNPLDSTTSRIRHSKSASTISLPAYSEHPSHDPPQYSQTVSKRNGHQIWYPPASSYPVSSQEAPVTTIDLPSTAPEYHSPEWRTYPAFPSAYPPTPLPASSSLPSSATKRPDDDRRVTSDYTYPPIPEDEQGFVEPLERQHEGHPGPVRGSSDSIKTLPRVNSFKQMIRQQDEDTLLDDSMCGSEAGLSEDDFGVSLRTPLRSSATALSDAYSSADSPTSTLSTTDNARSLRTKRSSDSLSSGSSSLVGQKRTYRGSLGKARNAFSISQSRSDTLRGRLVPTFVPHDPLQSSPSEGEDESQLGDGDDDSTKAKRQRVLAPVKRKSTVRPSVRGAGNARNPLPSRNTTTTTRGHVAAASQATIRRSIMTNSSTIKGRKPQEATKSSSTSSSQSGTLRGRAY